MAGDRMNASTTQTINYYQLYRDGQGYIRVISIELEEARRTIGFLTEQDERKTDQIRRLDEEIVRLKQKLKDFAVDELTGLPPLAVFDNTYAQVERDNHVDEEQAHTEVQEPAAMLVLDMDQFSQINDRHGQPFGDHVEFCW